MIGIVSTSIISGRMISDTGKYRVFPIAGTGTMALGLFLLSLMDAGTGFWEASGYMLVLGIGLGMVLQVMILAVQNDVDHKDLGTATAGVNFFRSMGGAFGVATFGSILNNRLDYYIPRFVSQDSLTGLDPAVLRSSPAQIHSLPPEVASGLIEAFSKSTHVVFLWAAPVALAAFALTWLLREIPLRDHAHIGSAEEDADVIPAEPALPL